MALSYVNFPVKVVMKSCKLIPTMALGIFILRRSYSVMEYSAAGSSLCLLSSIASTRLFCRLLSLLLPRACPTSLPLASMARLRPSIYDKHATIHPSMRPCTPAQERKSAPTKT